MGKKLNNQSKSADVDLFVSPINFGEKKLQKPQDSSKIMKQLKKESKMIENEIEEKESPFPIDLDAKKSEKFIHMIFKVEGRIIFQTKPCMNRRRDEAEAILRSKINPNLWDDLKISFVEQKDNQDEIKG